jgi:hypothetical protein
MDGMVSQVDGARACCGVSCMVITFLQLGAGAVQIGILPMHPSVSERAVH